MRAVAAMQRWEEAAGDSPEVREDAIRQVPLEAICNHSPESFAVRTSSFRSHPSNPLLNTRTYMRPISAAP